MSEVHVLFRGQQKSFLFDEVFEPDRYAAIGIPENMEVNSSTVTQEQVKMALAQKFDVGVGEFQDSFVEINPNGNITVRPDTTFG